MPKIKISANKNESDYFDLFQKFIPQNEVKVNNQVRIDIPIDEVQKKWDMNEKIVELFTRNIEKDQNLRGKYAVILIAILVIMLLALMTIFILTGLDILKYSDTTFNLFVTGGIAEVFILVRVIVKYLFKDSLTNPLNTILRHSNQLKYNNKTQPKFNNQKSNKSSDKPREI